MHIRAGFDDLWTANSSWRKQQLPISQNCDQKHGHVLNSRKSAQGQKQEPSRIMKLLVGKALGNIQWIILRWRWRRGRSPSRDRHLLAEAPAKNVYTIETFYCSFICRLQRQGRLLFLRQRGRPHRHRLSSRCHWSTVPLCNTATKQSGNGERRVIP
jgi:hypothetical protein